MKRRFLTYFFFFLPALFFAFNFFFSAGQKFRPELITPLGREKESLRGAPSDAAGTGSFAPLINASAFRVPLLVHHYVEIVTDERDFVRRAMSIRPDYFERQLAYLQELGYSFVTLTDLYRAGENKEKLPEKPVILTFDDGYRDFYTEAFPILKKHKVKAINFIVADFIGKNVNYMDEAQIREVVGSGLVEIGSHTLSHRYLTDLDAVEAEKEIKESKRLLEERFGVKVNHFAYPGGYSNPELEAAAAAAGYLTAAGMQPGAASHESNLYHLPRLRVGNISPAELVAVLEKIYQ